MTFDHNSFWASDDIDMGDLLHEKADTLFNTLDIPQYDTNEILEEENIIDDLIID